jgi:hypothetical protein
MVLVAFTSCKKKNSEISYQTQLNGVHNINLLQHSINEFTTTYIKAINDSNLINNPEEMFVIEGCYLTLYGQGTNHTLIMDYGFKNYVHDRRMEGMIKVDISGGVNLEGSIATFTFLTLKYDLLPNADTGLNVINSEICTVTLETKTLTTSTFVQDIVNFSSTDSLTRNWAAMTGQLVYDYKKNGTSDYYEENDSLTINMDATYIDYAGRTLNSSSTEPSVMTKDCPYLSKGKSQLELLTPDTGTGTLIFNEYPKVCMSRFKFQMGEKYFEFEQEWLVK